VEREMTIKLYLLILSFLIIALSAAPAHAQEHQPDEKKGRTETSVPEEKRQEREILSNMNFTVRLPQRLEGMTESINMMIRDMDEAIRVEEMATEKEIPITNISDTNQFLLSGGRDFPDTNTVFFYLGFRFTFGP
jgi:hypothetical protein